MTNALAAVGSSQISQAVEASTPVVFCDGVPDPDLSVVSATLESPMDTRQAILHLNNAWTKQGRDLLGKELTIAVAHALTDGEGRWQVLLSGVIAQEDREASARRDQNERLLQDRLSTILNEPSELLGPWPDDGLALEEVLSRLSARIDTGLVIACDEGLAAALVTSAAPQTNTIGSLLRPALSALGLVIEQSLAVQQQQVRRTLTVLPQRQGRRVSLPWPDAQGRGGSVVSVVVDRKPRPPRAWIAQGDRPMVEDTFALQPGWDPSLQGQPDSDYGRLTSSDFSRFGSVYRTYVLNEDGAYSGSPFDLGSAFDIGALFDRPGTIRSVLPFRACLTEDSAGRRLGAIVESSTDSGANWSVYPGQAVVMNDRGGVELIDDVLPSSILTAAKAGTLRIRATASLTSPNPLEERRWDGNPFAGPAPTRVLNFTDQFAWAYVSPTSIHRSAIDAGTLQADTIDQRPALRQALQEHIAELPGPEASVKLELAGAWSALRPGDRVAEALGPGVAIDGQPASFATRDAHIQRIDLTFGVFNDSPRTRLRMD